MLIIACVLAGLAAMVHVYIFVIESLQFEKPSTLRTFGIRAEDAAVMRPWAFNQGFYNLFLAIGAAAGVVLVGAGNDGGIALLVFTTASMLAAATVLVGSDRRKLRAALVQGAFPLLALVSTGLWWVSPS
ncbi:MAG TPA: DUF1304 domain-containing protein [Marmoricola sp.]|nr:DUF1304 domain-containing protein [Marmoricola sp.]